VRREPVAIEVLTARGSRVTRTLEMAALAKDDLDGDFLGKLGLAPYLPSVPAVMGSVVADSPAARAGLQAGDRVVAIDGRAVRDWTDFTGIVRGNAGRRIALDVERAGRPLRIEAVPALAKQGAVSLGRLGVEPPPEMRREFEKLATTVRYGPLEAVGPAARKVVDISAFCLKMLGRMVTGDVSWKNLSGPITIADYAGQSAKLGWMTWLGFLALVSVSLGVLNLLPIPLLDGGHLVYYFAEIVKGSPVSERTMEIGQRLGLAVLVGLTFFAIYNDINRLITG
jgi:regulator of sigma E protease